MRLAPLVLLLFVGASFGQAPDDKAKSDPKAKADNGWKGQLVMSKLGIAWFRKVGGVDANGNEIQTLTQGTDPSYFVRDEQLGDIDAAIRDMTESIRLQPELTPLYSNAASPARATRKTTTRRKPPRKPTLAGRVSA